MRKVIVQKSINKEDESRQYWYKINSPLYKNSEVVGSYHQFAQEMDEGCMSVVAVVELADGSIITPHVSAIRFIS